MKLANFFIQNYNDFETASYFFKRSYDLSVESQSIEG